jgi:hypothetical protein
MKLGHRVKPNPDQTATCPYQKVPLVPRPWNENHCKLPIMNENCLISKPEKMENSVFEYLTFSVHVASR